MNILRKHKDYNKLIDSIKRLPSLLSRMSLFQIYITFVQPHLGYSDILCYSPANGIFIDHLEKIQNKTCLGITGAIQGTSHDIFTKNWELNHYILGGGIER